MLGACECEIIGPYWLPVVKPLGVDGGGSINTCSDIARNPNMQSMPSIEYGTADLYRVGGMPMLISTYCWLLVLVLPAVATDGIVSGSLHYTCMHNHTNDATHLEPK